MEKVALELAVHTQEIDYGFTELGPLDLALVGGGSADVNLA